MGLFKKSWRKLHRKAISAYEDIAFRLHADGFALPLDFKVVIHKVVKRLNPDMSLQEAHQFVESNFALFKTFDVYDEIASECRARNPQIADHEIRELFDAVKRRFVEGMRENAGFLTFIVSRLIDPDTYNISRGAYLMEVATGKVPK